MQRIFTILSLALTIASCVAPPEPEKKAPLRDSLPVQELYILNSLAESLSLINIDRWQSALTPYNVNNILLTERVPNRLTIRGDYGYIVNSFANCITVFNRRSMEVQEKITLANGSNPWDIALFEKGGMLYALVSNFLSDAISIIRFNIQGINGQLLRSIALQPFPANPTYRPRPEGITIVGSKGYITCTGWNFQKNNFEQGAVAILDLSSSDPANWSPSSYISIATNPQAAIAFPSRNEAHIICTGINTKDDGIIAIIDTTSDTIVTNIPIGGSPGRFSINTNDNLVFLSGTSRVMSYNYNTRIGTKSSSNPILQDNSPTAFFSAISYVHSLNKLFVADFSQDRIICINPTTGNTENILPAGDGPIDIYYATLP